MNIDNLSKSCFIDKKYKVIKFIPEKNIKLAEYNPAIWVKKFPKDITNDVNFSKLQLTNIGLYSISTPNISLQLLNFIKEILNNNFPDLDEKKITITETNGGLGGFSIRLCSYFKKINIVEIIKQHADIIKNNLEVYNLDKGKNINIIIDDYLNVMEDLNNDIIISDLPWGGRDYFKIKSLKLGINNINIVCIINHLYKLNKFRIYILLAPKNFDIQDFIKNLLPPNIIIKNMGKHYFIAILN